MVHALMAAVISFVATPAAGLALTVRLRRHHRLAGYCALTAVASPALLVLTFVSGSLLGLAERVVIAVVFAWLIVLAFHLYRGFQSLR